MYLRHILDEAIYLVSASDGLDRATFLVDPTLRRAVARSVEIMREATKHLSAKLRDRYDDVAWRAMAGMRDRLEAIIAEEEAR